MPELPEVEVTRRGIAPHVEGEVLRRMVVRNGRLRWPVPDELANRCVNLRVLETARRGKYLLLHFIQPAKYVFSLINITHSYRQKTAMDKRNEMTLQTEEFSTRDFPEIISLLPVVCLPYLQLIGS